MRSINYRNREVGYFSASTNLYEQLQSGARRDEDKYALFYHSHLCQLMKQPSVNERNIGNIFDK